MAGQTLRPYQLRGVQQVLDAYKSGARSVLMTLPTGGGKTTIFSHLLDSIKARGLILVHRRELATQAANRLREYGVDFGFILNGEPAKPWARVQVATVQSLIRRQAPEAGLVVCDEAHLSTAETWQTILGKYPRARVLGCTATPWRLGGKPLVGAYDASVVIATPAELRAQGFLSPYQGFSYLAPDLSHVKKTGGEYNEQQSAAAMRAPGIVANVVEKWKAHASTLSTVVFNVTVEHSQQVTAEFLAAGVRAEHLDGGTPIEARRAILRRVETGETQVLCNVSVTVEGLDIPRLKCCVLNRPTTSLARAIQMMGRVRRPWNGVAARIHDHAFVIPQHGLPDAERDYSLHAKSVEVRAASDSLRQCPECAAWLERGEACPCGAAAPTPERKIETVDDAELFEFASEETPAPADPMALPPVAIAWTDPGKVIEGEYLGAEDEQGPGWTRKRYRVKGTKRVYHLPGSTRLDALMARISVGDRVRVTYKGETKLSEGRSRKEFVVERDDGATAEVRDTRWPEQLAVLRSAGRAHVP